MTVQFTILKDDSRHYNDVWPLSGVCVIFFILVVLAHLSLCFCVSKAEKNCQHFNETCGNSCPFLCPLFIYTLFSYYLTLRMLVMWDATLNKLDHFEVH